MTMPFGQAAAFEAVGYNIGAVSAVFTKIVYTR